MEAYLVGFVCGWAGWLAGLIVARLLPRERRRWAKWEQRCHGDATDAATLTRQRCATSLPRTPKGSTV